MAMLEEHRNAVYNYFAPRLGKEATQAMLSYFPARDVEEPATKADVGLARAEIKAVEARLQADIERSAREVTTQLTNRMLTVAGLGLAAITGLLALFT